VRDTCHREMKAVSGGGSGKRFKVGEGLETWEGDTTGGGATFKTTSFRTPPPPPLIKGRMARGV
jgi:hypothetical protein